MKRADRKRRKQAKRKKRYRVMKGALKEAKLDLDDITTRLSALQGRMKKAR